MKRILPAVWVFICILLWRGAICAAARPTFCIAGFANRVGETNVDGNLVDRFDVITEYLLGDLADCKEIVLIENSDIVQNAQMNEAALALEQNQPDRFYPHMDTDYVIFGYVTNLSIKYGVFGVTDLVRVGYERESREVCVDVSIKVLERKTGRIVFTATGSGNSSASEMELQYMTHRLTVGQKTIPEECVHNALEKAAHQISKKFLEAI